MFGRNAFGVQSLGLEDTSFIIRFVTNTHAYLNLEYRIFTSTREFITSSEDTPANQPFYSSLENPINFNWSVLGGDFINGFVTGSGDMELLNNNGEYDFIPAHYSLAGRDIEIKYGRQSDLYSRWATVFKGTASDFNVTETQLRVDLIDNGYKVAVPLQENVYGGTGGIDGTADLAGKRKPLAFGYVLNVSPPLVVPNSFLYQVHDGPVQAISAVYDSGVPLTFHANYASSTALLAASIPSGKYGTCLAEGMFRLTFLVSGSNTVTADVQGDSTDSFTATTAGIVQKIIARSTDLETTDLYAPSFTALDTLQPAPVGYWADENDTSTAADVISRLMAGIGGWAGFRRDGKLAVMRFDAPEGPPHKRINKIDIIDIQREKLGGNVSPPPAKWSVGYQRNYTIQTQPAGSVTSDRRSFIAAEYRYASASAAAIRVDYPFSKDPDPIEAYFNTLSDSQAEATRRLNLFRVSRAMYRITVHVRDGVRLNVGEIIYVTYDRWDLTTGRYLRVLGLNQSGTTDRIEIQAYG